MHARLLVTFNLNEAKDSAEARAHVTNYLNDEGFVGSGRWEHGIADWFVIGGRWSGILAGVERPDNPFIYLGAEDDALPVTEDLYDRFLKEYEGLADWETCGDYCDTKVERVSRAMIGTKWLVVVDYHN